MDRQQPDDDIAAPDAPPIGSAGIHTHEQASALATQLQQALDSRIVIEQAKGMVAGRHGVSLHDAFDRIRSHARSRGQRVRTVAQEICESGLDLTG